MAYRTIDSPVGPLLLAATEQGLIRVAYARENHEAVLQTPRRRISPRILHAPGRLEAAARELERVLRRPPPPLRPAAGLRLSAGFRAPC